ncbi:hypothetical protein [Pontibacter actiniarum]|nr:hypothetical protein [Pontibacter actiniarum]
MSQRNNTNRKAKRWLTVGAWVFGLAVLLFVGLFFFTNWMQGKLERMVQEQSDGVYRLNLHGLEVSPFIGSVSVDSLSLQPDYERWQQLQQQGAKTAGTLLDLRAHAIQLQGVNLLGTLFGSNVDVEQLRLQDPKLLMTLMRKDTTEERKPLHETVKGFMQQLHIGKIAVDNANLRYRESPQTEGFLFSLKKFNLTVDDIKLDSQAYYAPDRAYYAKQMVLEASKAMYFLPGGKYRFMVDTLLVDANKQELLAKQLVLDPLFPLSEVGTAKGKPTSSHKFKAKLLRVEGIDVNAHALHNSYIAQRVLLEEPRLEVFEVQQKTLEKSKKPLPHDLAQRVKEAFLLDTVAIRSGYIRYAEKVPEAQTPGHITFASLNATFSNLTNMPEQTSIQNPTVLEASTRVMGKAQLHVTFRLPLLHKNGYHTLRGSFGETNPEMLNAILVPTSFVRVESGYISSGEFSAELTNDSANGKMTVIYSNLDVEMLTKGAGGKQGLGKEVISEVADWVAIKDSNPMNGEAPRVGNITVTRNPHSSMFSYWKDCLASGFLSSMGLKSKARK